MKIEDLKNKKSTRKTKGKKLYLKSWFAEVYEDDFNEGEGKHVNSFNGSVNKSFDSIDDMIDYINKNIVYGDLDRGDFSSIDGRLSTSLLVDNDNSPASESEIEKWKKGDLALYSADYDFVISMNEDEDISEEQVSDLLSGKKSIPDKKEAKRIFYCINLNGKYGGTSKWSVYEFNPDFDHQPLKILWPEPDERGDMKDKDVKKQGFDIQNSNGNMPKFFFKIGGYGFSHSFELKERVARMFGLKTDEIEMYELRGFYPSTVN